MYLSEWLKETSANTPNPSIYANIYTLHYKKHYKRLLFAPWAVLTILIAYWRGSESSHTVTSHIHILVIPWCVSRNKEYNPPSFLIPSANQAEDNHEEFASRRKSRKEMKHVAKGELNVLNMRLFVYIRWNWNVLNMHNSVNPRKTFLFSFPMDKGE